jgi:hypothetical protein
MGSPLWAAPSIIVEGSTERWKIAWRNAAWIPRKLNRVLENVITAGSDPLLSFHSRSRVNCWSQSNSLPEEFAIQIPQF